jgi:hypothetical protein
MKAVPALELQRVAAVGGLMMIKTKRCGSLQILSWR